MNRRLYVSCVALMVASVCLVSQDASADEEGAKQAYAEGVELFDRGEFAQAADKFREAYRLKPSWKVLYNVGQSEAAAKRHGLALEAFEAYLTRGGDDVSDTRREEVLAEVERLRKMVGTVEISAPGGAVVFVDDVERGKAPLLGKLPVSAGIKHTAHAEVDGERVAERDFKVMGSDSISIDLSAGEAGPVAENDDSPPSPLDGPASPVSGGATQEGTSSGLAVGGWVMVGVGGAMLIAGAITGAMALQLDDKLYEDCPEDSCPQTQAYRDDIDQLNTLSAVTDVMLFVGGAVAATGAILLIVDATGDESDEPAVALTPAIGPGFGGASIQGRF